MDEVFPGIVVAACAGLVGSILVTLWLAVAMRRWARLLREHRRLLRRARIDVESARAAVRN